MYENNIVSKYFVPKTGMDESLSEFQERKKNNTGPKNLKKTKSKVRNRIKGQRDIRALIKKKDSDEVTYSKDFDKVCKKTGVDVDSEQLQLAIALSKSLHDAESIVNAEPQCVDPVTSQERILKIKRTLQGYGFMIPKTQITVDTTKRKRYKKQYKLMLTSEIERQQNISDKYAEVLARNIFKSSVNIQIEQCVNYDKGLYYMTTNIAYENLKNDDVYYVEDIFARPCNRICLLKDWSDIPGRPLSPVVEISNINFYDMTFTQQELDSILSGTIYAAQRIIANASNVSCINDEVKSVDKAVKLEHSETECTQINLSIKSLKEDNLIIMSNSHIRCISPDIFDDEVSLVIEYPKNDKQLLEQIEKNNSNQTYCMDLTECVNIVPDYACMYGKSKSQDKYHRPIVETRKSSDIMEITECVTSTTDQENIENIGLTDRKNYCNTEIDQNKNIDIMDLTQIIDYNLTAAQANGRNKLNNTVIVLDDELNWNQQQNVHTSKAYECSDIGDHNKESNYCDISCVGSTKIVDTITLDDENQDYSNIHDKHNLQNTANSFAGNIIDPSYIMNCENKIDLVTNVCKSNEVATLFDERQSEEIDLTQSSTSSKGDTEFNKLSYEQTECVKNLGKKDNVSIDYDEIFDDIVRESKSQNSIKSLGCIDGLNESNNSNTCLQTSSSSEVFDISDKELNYSLCQSKHEEFKDVHCHLKNNTIHYNIDTKSVSIIELNSTADNIKTNISPTLDLSQSQKLKFYKESSTPTKESRENMKTNILQTPKNCEYTIKTNEVTPMLDYAAMASPERNRELEKYGLKPFKRKRAIQILTHIYTQTHPMVESYVGVCPSPSKRQKTDENLQNSPKNLLPSPKPVENIPEIDKANNYTCMYMYAVTKEQPDIRNIDCAPEDWVFQKREKAKIHSCRVPLHVAFQNYVSCRQRLREAILRYEPVNIDLIHKDLVATGYRYNPKDLLRFMDKKCITVRTSDNNARNRKS